MVTTAIKLTTELRSFIIQISTRPNSALHILRIWKNVSMVNFAHLHTRKTNYLLSWLKSLNQIWISTYFILRQYGVLTGKMTMREMSASTPIIGKTTEENPQYLTTPKICARIGIQKDSSHLIKMAASSNIDVSLVMDGRNKSFILTISKLSNACTENPAKSLTVRIIIMKLIGSTRSHTGLDISQRLEQYPSQRTSTYLSLVMSV